MADDAFFNLTPQPGASSADDTPIPESLNIDAFEQAKNGDSSDQSLPYNSIVLPIENDSRPSPRRRRVKRNAKQLSKVKARHEVYLHKRRQHKKRRIFYSRIRIIFKLLFSILLLAALYLLANAPFWIFHTSHTFVKGNHLVGNSQIQSVLMPLEGTPLYRLNPLALGEKIEKAFPVINHIYIRRQLFPAGLNIMITEKPAWAVLYAAPLSPLPITLSNQPDAVQTLKKDTAATPVEKTSTSPQPEPLYLVHWDNSVTNLANYHLSHFDPAQMGNPIAIVADPGVLKPVLSERLHKIVLLLSHHPSQARLMSLDIQDKNDWIAQFDHFTVHFGRPDKTVMERLERLFTALPSIRQRQDDIQYVDLRWNQQVLLKKKNKTATLKQTEKKA